MIFETTREAIRQGITRSELRFNLLRICSRAPRTIHDLIHAPRYPGIEMGLFSLQSEINVTVELGECKNQGLLVRVGQAPDPVVPGGRTELLRTSLLAFLLCPELARAEPKAYRCYLESWLSSLEEGDRRDMAEALAAFPELAGMAFYSATGPEVDDPYFQGDPRRVFGVYHIRDLPTRPLPPGAWELWRALSQPPLGGRWPQGLRGPLWARLARAKWALWPRRRTGRTAGEFLSEPLAGPELFPGRLYPASIAVVQTSSSTSRPS
ncbi:hypothetical protein DRJ54_05945 [Candidatus Acetothermia bacterium]|nr:MAG: hypothetical protein DRJ54_05945 [Candidatus Acetothermia bacterium]